MSQIKETLKGAIASRLPQIPQLDLDAMMAEVMAEAQASVSESAEGSRRRNIRPYASLHRRARLRIQQRQIYRLPRQWLPLSQNLLIQVRAHIGTKIT